MRQEGEETLPGALASQLYLWVTGGQSHGETVRGSVGCPPPRKPTQGAREPAYLNSSSPESLGDAVPRERALIPLHVWPAAQAAPAGESLRAKWVSDTVGSVRMRGQGRGRDSICYTHKSIWGW